MSETKFSAECPWLYDESECWRQNKDKGKEQCKIYLPTYLSIQQSTCVNLSKYISVLWGKAQFFSYSTEMLLSISDVLGGAQQRRNENIERYPVPFPVKQAKPSMTSSPTTFSSNEFWKGLSGGQWIPCCHSPECIRPFSAQNCIFVL